MDTKEGVAKLAAYISAACAMPPAGTERLKA
jgi:hypothetical protein